MLQLNGLQKQQQHKIGYEKEEKKWFGFIEHVKW